MSKKGKKKFTDDLRYMNSGITRSLQGEFSSQGKTKTYKSGRGVTFSNSTVHVTN